MSATIYFAGSARATRFAANETPSSRKAGAASIGRRCCCGSAVAALRVQAGCREGKAAAAQWGFRWLHR
ncbi:MAG: hypothetical protein IT258_06080 [Saprospiraceae bacterium]|nr:hypothetical protein [Saprospiraceae bacterium]